MVVTVGINGFGRIGRIVFRKIVQTNDLEVSAINDPAVDIDYICYLIKFDSTHGRFNKDVTFRGNEITIDGTKIKVFHEKLPTNIPWTTADVQYVVEASGMFTNHEKASGHLVSESVKRVILTAPSVDIPMMILGVNEDKIKTEQKIISCASSTLYCLAPLIKVLEDNYGVAEGFVTSIHAMTPSLKPLDGLCLRGKHWRDHRSIHQNIIPAATGACKALGKIIPKVKNKMTGLAFRVPIVNVSILDVTIRLNKNTTLEDIIKRTVSASLKTMKNIIKISSDEAVSSDFMGDANSCILDANSSLQLSPNFYKLICWYENEYSYACRVIDTIVFSEKCFYLELLFKLQNANKFTPTFRRRPILCIEKHIHMKSSIQTKETDVFLSTPQDNNIYDKLSNEELKFTSKLCCDNSEFDNPEAELTNDSLKQLNDNIQVENPKVIENIKSIFHSYLARKPSEKSKAINIKRNFENVAKEITENKVKISNYNNNSEYIKFERKIELNQEAKKPKINYKRPMSGDFCGRNNFNNIFESKSMIMDDKSHSNLISNGYKIKEVKMKSNNEIIDNILDNENGVDQATLSENLSKKKLTNGSESNKSETYKNEINSTNQDVVNDNNFQTYNCNTYNINHVITESNQTNNHRKSNEFIIDYHHSGNNGFYNEMNINYAHRTQNEMADNNIVNTEINDIVSNSKSNFDQKSDQNKSIRIPDDTKDITKNTSVKLSLLEDASSLSPVTSTTISNNDRRTHGDIYDKLDSASASDSDNSFQIHERKSQVIDIADLTASIEDLARLENICKIIEISDDLSDRLFSTLDNHNQDFNNTWSFKDLCERLKLDEFYNNVFGQPIRDVCKEK